MGGTLLNLTLNFVITSLVLQTCLPDCVPHSVHESRMKRAPRAHEELSLTGATCSEAGILPPVRSHWRHERKCFGTDLPNPSSRHEDSYPGARDSCIQRARRSRIIRVQKRIRHRERTCAHAVCDGSRNADRARSMAAGKFCLSSGTPRSCGKKLGTPPWNQASISLFTRPVVRYSFTSKTSCRS